MRTTKPMCGLLLLLLWSGISPARERSDSLAVTKKRINQIGICPGFQNRLLADKQKTDLVYTSREYGGGLNYLNRGERSEFLVGARIFFGSYFARDYRDRFLYSETYDIEGNPTRDSVKLRSTLMSAEIECSYTGIFFRKNGYTIGAGPMLREMIVMPDNNIGLLSSLGLYAQLCATKTIGDKHEFRVMAAISLMGLNTRLPWHNTVTDPGLSNTRAFFKEGTSLVSLNRFQAVLFRFQYAFSAGKHGLIGLGYQGQWLNVPYHQPMRSFTQSIQLITAIKF